MAKRKTEMTDRVEADLEANAGEHDYTDVAGRVGSHPKAVGQCMKALGKRGRDDLCSRVHKRKTKKDKK